MHGLTFSFLAALTMPIMNVDPAWGIPVRINSTMQGFRVLNPITATRVSPRATFLYSSFNKNTQGRGDERSESKERRAGGVGSRYAPDTDQPLYPSGSTLKGINVVAERSRSPSLWRWRGGIPPPPISDPVTSSRTMQRRDEGAERRNERRQPNEGDPRNTVVVDSNEEYCLIVPLSMSTDIGDSEQPGGTTSYCSASARYSQDQGVFSPDFWSVVEYESGEGRGGGRWAQLTGCINPETLDRLDPDDAGGQYDSNGGGQGKGNPEYSVCRGYNHYVELIEPAAARACIKCCDDEDDCPVHRDTEGCPAVIQGNYFTCDVDGGGDDAGNGEMFPPQIGEDDGEGDDDDDDEFDRDDRK